MFVQGSDGNVGIGTASPVYPLNVYGDEVTAGNDFGVAQLVDTSAQAADVGGSIAFGGKYTDAGAYASWAFVKSGKATGTTAQYGSYLAFGTRTHGSATAERMRIDAAGAVTLQSLAGSGTRTVVADANGVLSAP